MSTTTVEKRSATTSWSTNKFQEQAASALTGQMLVTSRLLQKSSPELLSAVRQEWTRLKVQNFRAQGVKTPLDLVQAWTNYETNLFGSRMRYWGDDKQAHVEYEQCGCWDALEQLNPTDGDKELMCQGWEEMTQLLAKEFGFTGKEKVGTEPGEACCTITFTKV